jgi:aspartyl-tRNA(Asn)/glutamyl-tRNA(Gln) amidotransferase subunit A
MPQDTTTYAADPGGVTKLATQIRSGELTSTSLLERCLHRIDAVEPHVQAWRRVARETAHAEAEALDREARAGRVRGPLHGLPVGIKDIIDVRGMRTLANSRSRAGIKPACADAEIVAALRLAGAIILGKTHTTEFAYFDPSPARNPHNTGHTPGGSSSGSAAAVAAGMVPLALGTQTVASVNRPAAYCGIAAFKPSTQATCIHDVVTLAPSFDTVGFYGATTADAVALFGAVCAPFLGRPVADAPPSSYRIVRLDDPILEDSDPSILGALEEAAKRLGAAGHFVRSAPSPVAFRELFATQFKITQYEAARIHGALRGAATDRVGPKFLEMIEAGLAVRDDAYTGARRELAAARDRFWAAFEGDDALLFPAAPATAPEGLAWTGDPKYISPWTGLGGPIVTQPLGLVGNGLPIGMLVSGRPGGDRHVARMAVILSESIS